MKGKTSWGLDLRDIKDRYDKKYRKYLGKPFGKASAGISSYYKTYNVPTAFGLGTTPVSVPPPPQHSQLQPYGVSAAIAPNQMQMMSAQHAQNYQNMLLQQMQAQLSQQQAQMAAQAMMAGNAWTTQTMPNISTYTNTMTGANTITYQVFSDTTGTGLSSFGNSVLSNYALGNQVIPYNTAYPDPNNSTAVGKVLKVQQGDACEIQLPDGTTIHVSDTGSFQIDDKNAKVVYKANRARDFNRFINVSDRIEEFFDFCGEQKLEADEMMELPMKLFIGWLVLKAAEADKEAPPDNIKLIPDLRARAAAPRCRQCQRFIPYVQKRGGMEFCDAVCYDNKLRALKPKALPKPDASQICDPFLCEPTPGRSAVLQEVELSPA